MKITDTQKHIKKREFPAQGLMSLEIIPAGQLIL
jgi:hypothetical protein